MCLAGTPGNRTQHPARSGVSGFEDRGRHQPHNHSQEVSLADTKTVIKSYLSHSENCNKTLIYISYYDRDISWVWEGPYTTLSRFKKTDN